MAHVGHHHDRRCGLGAQKLVSQLVCVCFVCVLCVLTLCVYCVYFSFNTRLAFWEQHFDKLEGEVLKIMEKIRVGKPVSACAL